jgi:hypothetical protein
MKFEIEKFRDFIIYGIYTLTIIPIWGLLFLIPESPGNFGAFFGLIYTFYSSILIENHVERETTILKFLKIIGPLFYFFSSIFLLKINLLFLINPILISFLVFCLSYIVRNVIKIPSVNFFILSFFIIYSFVLFPMWENFMDQKARLMDQKNEIDLSIGDKQDVVNLNKFMFINQNYDTFNLINNLNNNKYIIIETWNENCPPCLRAIKDLEKFYLEIQNYADNYYLYKANKNFDVSHYKFVFTYPKIHDHTKIIIDNLNNFHEKLNLNSVPYFFIFNKEGKLVFKFEGYSSMISNNLKNSMRNIVSN